VIYVDDLIDYSELTKRPAPDYWCHMVTDGHIDELHQFAQRLGLRREHFQNKPGHPHYDLRPGYRTLALQMGAKEATIREVLDAIKSCLAITQQTLFH